MIKNKIVLFLDVDGVLNSYDIPIRIRRHKIHKKAGFSKETDEFNPFQKKVLRLAKLVKKYNIDVYVFSAWTDYNLQPHLPFKLKGDTGKYIDRMNKISKEYKHSILIDDEIISIGQRGVKGQDIRFEKNITLFQPKYDKGLVRKDFIKLDKIFQEMMNNSPKYKI